jgi:p-cumate 2,3-dioxygenase alpha subunit
MDAASLVIDDRRRGVFRVNRTALRSPALLELEWERVFDQVWLYVGHESEIEQPGDYRRRTIARRPVLFVRGSDGQVRVLLNVCRHRGAVLCRTAEGNAQSFQCFYHAWTYDNRGALTGVPDEAGYGPGFDRGELAMAAPPRLDSYRGFYFISFNPAVEPLYDYLAGAREYIDLVVDQAELGMRVIAGTHKQVAQAQWKLVMDNFIDPLHVPVLHQTYLAYISKVGGTARRPNGTARALGNGHAVTESFASYGRPVARWYPLFGEAAKPEIEARRARLITRYGEERATRMADNLRLLRIFPNLLIQDVTGVTIRTVWPTAVDQTELVAWELAPREESGEQLHRRLQNFLAFLGPAGFGIPDDVEAVESCQSTLPATEIEWQDYSRAMADDAAGVAPDTCDLQHRAFWRQWLAHLRTAPPTNGAAHALDAARAAAGAGR